MCHRDAVGAVLAPLHVQRIVEGKLATEHELQRHRHFLVNRRGNGYERRRGFFVLSIFRITANGNNSF